MYEICERDLPEQIVLTEVAFPQILSAYDAFSQWISAKRLSVAGSPPEVYFTDFGSAAPTDEVCDAAFPVRSA
jgi:hypothetical protein